MNINTIPVLSTALCLMICWALFAVFCSFIHEAVSQIKAERGRFMKKYLLQQLQDLPNGVNWGALVYLHGAVDLLSRAPGKPTNEIPADVFAKTLVEVLGSSTLVLIKKGTRPAGTKFQNPLLDNFKLATLVLKPSDVISFLTQAIQDAELKAAGPAPTDESLIYKELILNISGWFNNLTERVGYWYKKKTKQRLFILGLLLALVLNVDSIRLFKYYNRDPSARASLITYYNGQEQNLRDLAKDLDKADSIREDSLRRDSLAYLSKLMIAQFDTLSKSSSIPIGWPEKRQTVTGKNQNGFTYTCLKILGMLISAFAASFGAPFWFDLIKKMYSKSK